MPIANNVALQLPNQVSSLKIYEDARVPVVPTVIGEHYIVDFPINEMEVLVSLPEACYSANPPFVLAMINGGPTELTVTGVMEDLPPFGMIYTKVKFNFNELAVGKRCHAWLVGGG